MYRRYYSYNDMPQVAVPKENKAELPAKCTSDKKPICEKPHDKRTFSGLETDDIILAVIILVLLMDDGYDTILLLALAAVFLTGII